MKRILITQRIVSAVDYPEVRDALDVRWAQFCRKLGVLPIPLPSTSDPEKYFAELGIQGVILTGGNDLAYTAADAEAVRLSELRDEAELEVLRLAIAGSIPLLGICRGLQLIAHHFAIPLQPVDGHTAVRHPISAARKSNWYDCLSRLKDVNSYHRWAPNIESVGSSELLVAAVSADENGLVEAIEHCRLPILGIMWHPERDEPFDSVNLDLIRNFFLNR